MKDIFEKCNTSLFCIHVSKNTTDHTATICKKSSPQREYSVVLPKEGCRYRFSGKPISTYMSLTLARLCGEWRLVSGNYELVSGNYEAQGASGGKYKVQIVIFRILAAVNRFSCISRKADRVCGKSDII